jgi:DNA-binding Lrp family transcriptional regulator
MTQRDRDRLVVLQQAHKRQITQKQAAEQMGCTERHLRRLLKKLKSEGDKAVIHGLRGRASNRKRSAKDCDKIVRILSQEVYHGFGPTLAAEYLAQHHKIQIGREGLRKLMMTACLWQGRQRKVEQVHVWRPRRSSRGELVQWDTSEHDWLEGRGEKMYLIHMIDDATSELTARFVAHDSTEENLRLLKTYLEANGRPLAFYTDKASLFQTAPKIARDQKQLAREERQPLPPTQIGRALRELGMVWQAAHSPQAKGRVERSFQTAQDRLVKGLRVAQVKTLEQANRYLETEFLPWWNQHLKVVAKNSTDAHRPLGAEHDLIHGVDLVSRQQWRTH